MTDAAQDLPGAYAARPPPAAPRAPPRRARLQAGDLPPLLWRERAPMAVVAAAVLALGLIAAAAAPQTYTAHAMLWAPGGPPLAAFAAVDPAARRMKVEPDNAGPLVRVSLRDRDPRRAAAALNRLSASYLAWRAQAPAAAAAALEPERQALAARLAQADRALGDFLARNGIADFEGEQAALAALRGEAEAQRSAAEAQLAERQGAAGALEAELSRLPDRSELWRDEDNTAGAKLAQLRVQRAELLATYRPDAVPVRAVEHKIAALQQAMATGEAQGPGAERTGPNPLRQTVASEAQQAQADIAALRRRRADLDAQAMRLAAASARLSALTPDYLALSRARDALAASLSEVSARQEARAQGAAAAGRIVKPASPPAHGKNPRWLILALSVLAAAACALAVGAARARARPGVRTRSVAERTFGLPVLGAAALRG
ncbi:MAG TPA: hypothetical protein VGS12_18215 [Caulobacteraceae bacterium]|nr:hypothetical protein [Caulobacteraceae bacterium]